jgi:hypothetical protein
MSTFKPTGVLGEPTRAQTRQADHMPAPLAGNFELEAGRL